MMTTEQRSVLMTAYSAKSEEWNLLLDTPLIPTRVFAHLRWRLASAEFISDDPVLESWRLNWLDAITGLLNERVGCQHYPSPFLEVPDDLAGLDTQAGAD